MGLIEGEADSSFIDHSKLILENQCHACRSSCVHKSQSNIHLTVVFQSLLKTSQTSGMIAGDSKWQIHSGRKKRKDVCDKSALAVIQCDAQKYSHVDGLARGVAEPEHHVDAV